MILCCIKAGQVQQHIKSIFRLEIKSISYLRDAFFDGKNLPLKVSYLLVAVALTFTQK